MNTEQNPIGPEAQDDEKLKQPQAGVDDVAEERPDNVPELPSSLSFPNKFFQG
jgi:hypothetical protein